MEAWGCGGAEAQGCSAGLGPCTSNRPSSWNHHTSHQDCSWTGRGSAGPAGPVSCLWPCSVMAHALLLGPLASSLPSSSAEAVPAGQELQTAPGRAGVSCMCWVPSARPHSPRPDAPGLVPQPCVTRAEQRCYFCPWRADASHKVKHAGQASEWGRICLLAFFPWGWACALNRSQYQERHVVKPQVAKR